MFCPLCCAGGGCIGHRARALVAGASSLRVVRSALVGGDWPGARAALAPLLPALGVSAAAFPPAAADTLLLLPVAPASPAPILDAETAAAMLRQAASALQQSPRGAPPEPPSRLPAEVLFELRRAAATVCERAALAALRCGFASVAPDCRPLADAATLAAAFVGPHVEAVAVPLRALQALRAVRLADSLGGGGAAEGLGAAVAELSECAPPPWVPAGAEATWAAELRGVRARHAASSAAAGLVSALAQVRREGGGRVVLSALA